MEILKYKQFDYVLCHPTNFDSGKKYPLVIYLHGAGGRGRDIDLIANHPFFSESAQFLADAVSVAPQCYSDSWFNIFEQLQEFLEQIIALDYVDKSRVYMLGASMGGYGTWQMAQCRPELFAAIVPICGGGMYWNTGRLKDMGVWAFHGADDKTVLCEESVKMVEGINKRGGNAKLTIYENTAHNAWTPTFRNTEMWKWLFEQRSAYVEEKSEYDNVAQFG
jgi:predicted peptidase